MATRTPPSPEQVLEVLRRTYPDLDERLIPRDQAVTSIRHALRTTKANADLWLDAAAVASPDLWTAYGNGLGTVISVVVPNNDRWPELGPRVRSPVVEEGLAPKDGAHWTNADEDGYYLPEDRQGEYRRTHLERNVLYVATTAAIKHLFAQATQEMREGHVSLLAEDIVRGAAFENEHGNAADYLRGLLHAAGITERGGVAEVHTWAAEGRPGDSTPYTSVELRVTGSGVDLLAAVLQRLGVPPIAKD
jgi:hypothetical protein